MARKRGEKLTDNVTTIRISSCERKEPLYVVKALLDTHMRSGKCNKCNRKKVPILVKKLKKLIEVRNRSSEIIHPGSDRFHLARSLALKEIRDMNNKTKICPECLAKMMD